MPPQSLPLFLAVTLAVVLVPGPSVIFVMTSTLRRGRAAGLWAVAGLEAGLLVHVVAASLGLSALVASAPVALGVLKVSGAAYLAVLGLARLREGCRRRAPLTPSGEDTGRVAPGTPGGIFRAGFLVDLLNPKTVIFFVALFPQFVDPARGTVRGQTLVLGGIVVVLATLCDSAYAVATDLLGRRRAGAQSSRLLAMLPGAALLALAVGAALS